MFKNIFTSKSQSELTPLLPKNDVLTRSLTLLPLTNKVKNNVGGEMQSNDPGGGFNNKDTSNETYANHNNLNHQQQQQQQQQQRQQNYSNAAITTATPPPPPPRPAIPPSSLPSHNSPQTTHNTTGAYSNYNNTTSPPSASTSINNHYQHQRQSLRQPSQMTNTTTYGTRGNVGGIDDRGNGNDYRPVGTWASFKHWAIQWRGSRRLVLVIVAIALLLDNMLLTTVVPIIPEFLYDIRHPDAPLDSYPRTPLTTTTTPTPPPICQQPKMEPTTEPTDGIEFTSEFTTIEAENASSLEARHKELVGETVEVGLMFASKAFVQLLANPIVGPLTHRIGYSIPMFTGFVIMFISTIIFAFGRSYGVLFLARALQGIGSSCSSVSGMGMLADRYTDDKERGNAMGIALGGLALGVLIGPPFGGIMYEFVGKSAPFLVLSALALGDGLLQLFMLQPSIQLAETDPPSLKELITDPYIIIAAGAITFANMGIAMLEPSLPIWMMDNMGASRWEQGVTFLPASISYLIGTNLFGPLGHRIGRWLAALLGLVIIGICLLLIPMATSINHLILPNAGLGFAIGMVDSCMMPELGFLVDIRHTAVYGSVYALGDVAFCVGFAVGPALSGTLVNSIGFEWMLVGIAILCFLYAPLLTLLKAPPTKEEKKSLIIGERASVRYVTYQNEEDEE